VIRVSLRRLLILSLFGALLGCESMPPSLEGSPTVHAGYRPASDTTEAGLWLRMDEAEEDLKTSGKLITGTPANEYLEEIICKLDSGLCEDIRVYLVRLPYFNATMAPNGFMQVWSGLLLRTENEAQLAFILGHEIAHYQHKHSLQLFYQAKHTANMLAPFQVAAAAGGVGYAGSLAEIGAYGMLMKYSRDHEREADAGGFKMAFAAGYDPHEAAKVWEDLQEEKDALDEGATSLFLSTHPSSSERLDTLKQMASTAEEPSSGWYKGAERYEQVIDPLKFELFQDELRLRQYPATQVLLDRASEAGERPSEIAFFQAELYSARAEPGDLQKAEAAYRQSLTYSDAPPESYRELAMIYIKSGRAKEAVPLFQTYLSKRPDAFDRSMVRAYIQRIDSGEE
jgi:predicted Zn-dependent protease